MLGDSFHFFFKNNNVFRAEASNDIYLYACCIQCFSLWIGDGTADAAANYTNSLGVVQFGWESQRTYYVLEKFAFFHFTKHNGRTSNSLYNQGDSSFFPIIVCNCDRHSFALFINTKNNKLAWEYFPGNKWRVYFYQYNVVVKFPFFYNFVHFRSPLHFFENNCLLQQSCIEMTALGILKVTV